MIAANDFSQNFPKEIHQAIKELWDEPNVQEAYDRKNEFYLMDCAK